MRRIIFLLITALFILLCGCSDKGQVMDGDGMLNSYRQISQEEAARMMEQDDGHVIVDVRRQDEYDAGHIPGAILIPNESIDAEPPAELPDKNQIILIYCRSGNRSKQAAEKLFNMGYTNIYEFGGITDWKGEIVTGSTDVAESAASEGGQTVRITYDSFEGGGLEYTVKIDNPSIISYTEEIRRSSYDEDGVDIDGAGYDVIFEFTGLQQGETKVTISARSPIADNFDAVYTVKVDQNLNVTMSFMDSADTEEEYDLMEPTASLVMEVNGKIYYPELMDNASAEAFFEKLEEGKLVVDLHDYGNFEKVGSLPWELPRNDEKITTVPGDIILYQGNQITIYYDENTWDFTRLAKINYVTKEELLDVLGEGDVTVSFWLEWSE